MFDDIYNELKQRVELQSNVLFARYLKKNIAFTLQYYEKNCI